MDIFFCDVGNAELVGAIASARYEGAVLQHLRFIQHTKCASGLRSSISLRFSLRNVIMAPHLRS